MWPLHKSICMITITVFLIDFGFASQIATLPKVCKTPSCNEAAQFILNNMDKTIDPCVDFYQFACGRFVKEAILPDDIPSISLDGKNAALLGEKLKQAIEVPLESSDPKTFKLLQSYYNVCLNTDRIEGNSIKEVNYILNSLGNWPVVVGKSWDESNFNWQDIIYQLRKIGYINAMRSLIKFNTEIDEKNTTRHVITLDQAETGIDQVYLSKGLQEKVVQAYYKYMIELAKIFGAKQKQAEKELSESLNFEIKLAKISLAKQERRNVSKLYNLKTVRQLQLEYPNIPWEEYLNQLVSPQSQVSLTDEVIVKVPSFLESLSQLLSKTPKRVLANYIIWRVVQESIDYMNERTRKVKAAFSAAIEGIVVEQPRWIDCLNYVTKNLPVAIGALYVRKNFDKKIKNDVEKLVADLQKSFEGILNKVDWMDKETKTAAQTKLKSVTAHNAFPDEFFDNKRFDKQFENLKVDEGSFLKSHLQLNLYNLEYKLEQLQPTFDKNKAHIGFQGVVASVNAFYIRADNSIQIPAGILQEDYFSNTRPNYMNYGLIGWTIGHEITHGFDDRGSQYDENGNVANWWSTETRKEYLKRTQCIIDQYSNYTVEEVGLNINGQRTQGENIADNGGIKEAYYAYVAYEKQNGEEPRLPELPYSPRQMFWISAANGYCSKSHPEVLKNNIITDVHSPDAFRVIGSISNMIEFANDFKCPSGSPMNPFKKCIIW